MCTPPNGTIFELDTNNGHTVMTQESANPASNCIVAAPFTFLIFAFLFPASYPTVFFFFFPARRI